MNQWVSEAGQDLSGRTQIFVTRVYLTCHGREGSGAHGGVGQALRAAVRMDGVQVRAMHIHSSQDERCAHMALVSVDRGVSSSDSECMGSGRTHRAVGERNFGGG